MTNFSKLRVICNIISRNCNLLTFSRYNFLFVFLRFSILLFNKLIILFIFTASSYLREFRPSHSARDCDIIRLMTISDMIYDAFDFQKVV